MPAHFYTKFTLNRSTSEPKEYIDTISNGSKQEITRTSKKRGQTYHVAIFLKKWQHNYLPLNLNNVHPITNINVLPSKNKRRVMTNEQIHKLWHFASLYKCGGND